MRKFKVLKCVETITRRSKKIAKKPSGETYAYVVYREVNRGDEGWYPGAYGHENIHVGDIIELDGHLADKAARNPDFEEVFEAPKVEVVKKKRRKKKRAKRVKANAA